MRYSSPARKTLGSTGCLLRRMRRIVNLIRQLKQRSVALSWPRSRETTRPQMHLSPTSIFTERAFRCATRVSKSLALRDYFDATIETAQHSGKQLCNVPQDSSDSSRNCDHAASFGVQEVELSATFARHGKGSRSKTAGPREEPGRCEL